MTLDAYFPKKRGRPPPEAEQIPEKKQPTLFDFDDDASRMKDELPKNKRGV